MTNKDYDVDIQICVSGKMKNLFAKIFANFFPKFNFGTALKCAKILRNTNIC